MRNRWLPFALLATVVLACDSGTEPAPNEAPTASAGPDMDVAVGAAVTLDASASRDPEGVSLDCTWTQLRGPDVTAGVGHLKGHAPGFTAPSRVSTLLFELVVDDGENPSAPDTIRLNVMEDPAHAVFVRPSGSDGAAGTRSDPLQTLQAAVQVAAAGGHGADVYAAEGAYVGRLTLADGVSVYGGFDSDWARWSEAAGSELSSDTIGILGDSVFGVTLDGLTVTAADATAMGTSSYGVLLRHSERVIIRNSVISAGAGAPGATGSAGWDGEAGGDGSAGGSGGCDSNVSNNGGPAGVGWHYGGRGGSGHYTYAGYPGTQGAGPAGGAGGAGGGWWNPGGPGEDGQPGGAGAPGSNGHAGADYGSLGPAGYRPAFGGSGEDGRAGSGGGGGGAGGGQDERGWWEQVVEGTGNGGGGGGAGGYPGKGGEGGQGGGGSFGITVLASLDVEVVDTQVRTATGGDGGGGAVGGQGGPGGLGAAGYVYCTSEIGAGGNGADGGAGGAGGIGGGGGGGPSIGILYDPTSAVTSTGNTIEVGTGGAGGASDGSPGEAGMVAAQHQG